MAYQNSLDFLTRNNAQQICALDAKKLTSDTKTFIRMNSETWYIICNTWLNLIEDYSTRTRLLVQDALQKTGLLSLIQDADALAYSIMTEAPDERRELGIWKYLFADIAESADAERQLLTILRFGKRLSPANADIVESTSLEKFEAVNAKNKQKYYSSPLGQQAVCGFSNVEVTCRQSPLITCNGIEVKTECSSRVVPDYDLSHKTSFWKAIEDELAELMPSFITADGKVPTNDQFISTFLEDAEFSNGSTYERARTLQDKLNCLSSVVTQLGGVQYPLTYQASRLDLQDQAREFIKPQKDLIWDRHPRKVNGRRLWQIKRPSRKYSRNPYFLLGPDGKKHIDWLENECRVVAVPKSYKTARIIAMEQTWRGYVTQSLRKLLVNYLKKSGNVAFCDVEDQTVNQEWCRLGSIDGNYITCDLTSASDSIDVVIGYAMNASLNAFWDGSRSYWLRMPDGRRIKNHIFLTSGTPVTFVLESIYFLAVARAVTNYVQVFYEEKLLPPRTFGDDLIVDWRILDTLKDVLSALGHVLNLEKTFDHESSYRESCGEEYRYGYPLHTIKWPRSVIKYDRTGNMEPESLQSMCSLQHRLYGVSWRAQMFMYLHITSKHEWMTSSLPNTECDDLWSETPRFGLRYAPMTAQLKSGLKSGSVEPRDFYNREHHSKLVTSGSRVRTAELKADVQMYAYVQFLKHGPRYATKLDELLHVSEPTFTSSPDEMPEVGWSK